jgi:hypothetical protein
MLSRKDWFAAHSSASVIEFQASLTSKYWGPHLLRDFAVIVSVMSDHPIGSKYGSYGLLGPEALELILRDGENS